MCNITDFPWAVVVLCTHHNRVVVGSNPAGVLGFFKSYLSLKQCVLNLGLSRRCNTTDFPIK